MQELKGRILAGKILVKPEVPETKTASGLYIPSQAQAKDFIGTVVLTGEAKVGDNMEAEAGDKVIYGKYSGTELTFDKVNYLLMEQSDILLFI